MPPPNGKSEHVIGNCISLLAITIVMLADYAAMNITSKHMIGNCILRLAISIHMLSISTTPACFVRHFAIMICAGLRNNDFFATWRRTPCRMVFQNAAAKRKLPRQANPVPTKTPRPKHPNPPKSGRQELTPPSEIWSSTADAERGPYAKKVVC